MTGVTLPGVTAEQRNTCVLVLMTGVACEGDLQAVGATVVASFGQGSTLPVSILLLLQTLTCGCINGAGGVGRVISTELRFDGENLTSCGLLEGLAGILKDVYECLTFAVML